MARKQYDAHCASCRVLGHRWGIKYWRGFTLLVSCDECGALREDQFNQHWEIVKRKYTYSKEYRWPSDEKIEVAALRAQCKRQARQLLRYIGEKAKARRTVNASAEATAVH